MWNTIFKTLTNGEHEFLISFVHWNLLLLDVGATAVVGAGILWESEALIVRHKIGRAFVLWGVVTEMVCSVALFVFDEGISGAQQSLISAQNEKIIALEKRLAPRWVGGEFAQALEGQPTGIVEIWYVRDVPDADSFSLLLYSHLVSGAKWIANSLPQPIRPEDPSVRNFPTPSAMLKCGIPTGITVMIGGEFPHQSATMYPNDVDKTDTAFGALVRAFEASVKAGNLDKAPWIGTSKMLAPGCPDLSDGVLRIVIAPKE